MKSKTKRSSLKVVSCSASDDVLLPRWQHHCLCLSVSLCVCLCLCLCLSVFLCVCLCMSVIQPCRSRGEGRGPWPPIVDWVDFLNAKTLDYWDVRPALFSKLTLFSLQEVFCGPCGPRICQKYGPTEVFKATTKKVFNFFWEKNAPHRENAGCAPGVMHALAVCLCIC